MSFLRDSTVSITIVMAIVYVIHTLMTGQQFVEEKRAVMFQRVRYLGRAR